MSSPPRRGVTMMEAAIGTLLVGGVLAATLNIVGPTVRVTRNAGDTLLAVALADDLIDEILARPFADPTNDTGAIGRETGESAPERLSFDDADDFHGWSSSPLNEHGEPIQVGAGWLRSATVQHVPVADPSGVSGGVTGVKRITVTVRRHGVLLAQREILRTASFDTAGVLP